LEEERGTRACRIERGEAEGVTDGRGTSDRNGVGAKKKNSNGPKIAKLVWKCSTEKCITVFKKIAV